MNNQFYHFTMGEIDFTMISDGVDVISRERFLRRFPDVGESELRQAFETIGRDFDEAVSGYNMLIARIGNETILVDTGERGDLIPNMLSAGINPNDITLIILTHTHGDHVLGILDSSGQPNFPNARYVISQTEFDLWQGKIVTGLVHHQAILDHVQRNLRLINMDESIIEGITAFSLVGHTAGQIGLKFESDGEVLLHLADLVHSPIQIAHPDWCAKFDADKTQSIVTRRKALQQAHETGYRVFFYHLDFPALGTIQMIDDVFTFERIS